MTLLCLRAESRTREDFLLMQLFEHIFAASFDFSRNGVAVVAMPLRVEGISRKRRDWMRLNHVHPGSSRFKVLSRVWLLPYRVCNICISLRIFAQKKSCLQVSGVYCCWNYRKKYNQDGQAKYMSETALSITFQDACHVMSWMLHEAVPFGTSGSKKVALLQIYANIAMRTGVLCGWHHMDSYGIMAFSRTGTILWALRHSGRQPAQAPPDPTSASRKLG